MMDNLDTIISELKKLPKDDLILFFTNKFYFDLRKLKLSDVRFILWNIEHEKVQKLRQDYLNNSKSQEWVKNHDVWAKKFNNEKDIDKKIKYLEKVQFYYNLLVKHNKEWDEIEKKQKKVDNLYKKIKEQKGE